MTNVTKILIKVQIIIYNTFMKKLSINKCVVLPLFILTLITSFYVMQPHAAFAAYVDDGGDFSNDEASSRFDETKIGVNANGPADQDIAATGTSASKITETLKQFIDCDDPYCDDNIYLYGRQNVDLDRVGTGSIDAAFKLKEVQKVDAKDQQPAFNNQFADQDVDVDTTSNGKFDSSFTKSTGGSTSVYMNTYQYDRQGSLGGLDDYKIGSDLNSPNNYLSTFQDESGGGNDDVFTDQQAYQYYKANAGKNGAINVANQGKDQSFNIAQFNAACDDNKDFGPLNDIFCNNYATQDVNLESTGGTTGSTFNTLAFNTPTPIDIQQVDSCKFSNSLECTNDARY